MALLASLWSLEEQGRLGGAQSPRAGFWGRRPSPDHGPWRGGLFPAGAEGSAHRGHAPPATPSAPVRQPTARGGVEMEPASWPRSWASGWRLGGGGRGPRRGSGDPGGSSGLGHSSRCPAHGSQNHSDSPQPRSPRGPRERRMPCLILRWAQVRKPGAWAVPTGQRSVVPAPSSSRPKHPVGIKANRA